MAVIPVGPGLVSACKVIKERVVRDDGALADERSAIHFWSRGLEDAVPMLVGYVERA